MSRLRRVQACQGVLIAFLMHFDKAFFMSSIGLIHHGGHQGSTGIGLKPLPIWMNSRLTTFFQPLGTEVAWQQALRYRRVSQDSRLGQWPLLGRSADCARPRPDTPPENSVPMPGVRTSAPARRTHAPPGAGPYQYGKIKQCLSMTGELVVDERC